MKKVLLIILIIAIILLGGFLIYNRLEAKFDYNIEDINEFQYYIYRENEKFGVIDRNAQIIVKANYTNVIIPNPEKDIFVCYNGENSEILNNKAEKIFTEYEQVNEIKLKNVASTLTYEKNILTYKKDGLYGLIDFNGKVITKNEYDSIENLKPTEGKFLVSKNGKYGVIDANGNELVNVEYDNITEYKDWTLRELTDEKMTKPNTVGYKMTNTK